MNDDLLETVDMIHEAGWIISVDDIREIIDHLDVSVPQWESRFDCVAEAVVCVLSQEDRDGHEGFRFTGDQQADWRDWNEN